MTITFMTPSVDGGGWTESNPPVIAKLNEKLNIDLKLEWVPHDSYKEKLNVIAASNSFPDVFLVSSSDLYNSWKARGVFLDVKPYLDQYPNLVNYLDKSGYELMNPPGKYYGFTKCA